jgi:sugar phosphate isomerase/epimerase
MYFTGFADEASGSLDVQVKVTKELGWTNIESRNVAVGGFPSGNIHDIPEAAFDLVVAKLAEAGVKINCFGSTIANWGKNIEDPFDITVQEIKRCIPRMQKLGTPLIRIMSYAERKEADQMEAERFRRLREICRMFADAGITVVHENCGTYGGMCWSFALKMVENVPGLKLVFDTGNPVVSDDHGRPKPYPKQSAWEFYDHVRDHVAYVHIKDGVFNPEKGNAVWCLAGEGQGDVRRIVRDLLSRGYDGGLSIEPHMHSRIYVEYGRKMMKMVEDIRAELALIKAGKN